VTGVLLLTASVAHLLQSSCSSASSSRVLGRCRRLAAPRTRVAAGDADRCRGAASTQPAGHWSGGSATRSSPLAARVLDEANEIAGDIDLLDIIIGDLILVMDEARNETSGSCPKLRQCRAAIGLRATAHGNVANYNESK
jgi:hypothetical protein